MRTGLFKTMVTFVVLLILSPVASRAQENFAMSTGNYAGIAGVWLNPASIADSRYKFDINIVGVNSWYINNYLLVKRTAFVNRLFHKAPYNSSYDAVKNDLLQEQLPVNGKVHANVETRLQFPLSFMATTGKKSAIAFSMNNRTANQLDNLNPELARLFFHELSYPKINGQNLPIDSLNYRFLNWQEIAFTYSRVLINSDHHFLKMGVTAKWLGANSGGYIKIDKGVVNFRDSTTMSLSSPLIQYARTSRADIDQFRRRDILNNLEDQAFGWDAGLVYEFRAKVKKFKYIDESFEEQTRRDMNKYMFRLGLSLIDMGKFTLDKKPLTNDHSANFVNWDFSSVKAGNFSDFDTAYSKKVNYIPGAPTTFTMRLPAALVFNFDLHLLGGFYINAAVKAPFEGFAKTTDNYIAANKWVAVTPRFESKFFGFYLPVSRAAHKTNIGATVKFGPFYIGSSNLVEVFSNESALQADYHAGFRWSVPYGKPSKLSKAALAMLNGSKDNSSSRHASQQQVDSLVHEVDKLKWNMADTSRRKGMQVIINNEGVASTIERNEKDDLVIQNKVSDDQRGRQQSYINGKDQIADSLARQLAETNVENKRLQRDLNGQRSGSKKNKKDKTGNQSVKMENNNDEVVRELDRINRQMKIQNAALIGGGTAAIIATSGNKDDKDKKKDANGKDTVLIRDTTKLQSVQKTDTIYIRDTVRIAEDAAGTAFKVVASQKFEPILFANGSVAISAADKKRLAELANETKQHPDWRLEITGMTDANGSVATNRKMAASRCTAVSNILLQNGVKDNQVIVRSKLSDTNNIAATDNPRRIAIRTLSR